MRCNAPDAPDAPVRGSQATNVVMHLGAWLVIVTAALEFFLRPGFLPSPGWMQAALAVGLPPVALVWLRMLRTLNRRDLRAPRAVDSADAPYRLAVVAFCAAFALGTVVCLQSTLPGIVTRFAGTPATAELTVAALHRNTSRRYCNEGLTVAGLPFYANDICGLPRAQWEKIRPGDRLLVEGEANRFGFVSRRVVLILPK